GVDFFRLQDPESPEAVPFSPDYVPGPKEPEQAPLSPNYVPRPEYLEYLAPSDEEVFVKDQPYATVVDPVPSTKETKPFETDESIATLPPAYRTTVRMSIQAQTAIPFPSEAEVDRLLAIPTPPPSPLTPLSSPLPWIPSPPFPVPSLPTTSLTYTKAPLGYRAVGIWSTGGFRADYDFVGTIDANIRRDPNREIGYRIIDVWEDPYEIAEEIPATDVAELGKRMIDFFTTIRQDTDEIYV
nr:hypothetical protein [Tanacetum cinerariifolium]